MLENPTIYGTLWKNTVEADRPQMAIRHMRFACWIPKTTNTHSIYVVLLLFHWNHCCTKDPQC